MKNTPRFKSFFLTITSFVALSGIALSGFAVVGCSTPSGPKPTVSPSAEAAAQNDDYLWLEEVESPQALKWVGEQNKRSLEALQKDPRYHSLEKSFQKILSDQDRIPSPRLQGDLVYNFWQDSKNPRGIWRRTTLKSYRQKKPSWEVLLDIDELNKKEKKEWVWKGASCLEPARNPCLVKLSPGGKDAVVAREFDTQKKQFVAGGFEFPESMTYAVWLDADTLLIATDFGPGSLAPTGYALQIKQLRRGQALKDAKLIFAGQPSDVAVDPSQIITPEGRVTLVSRSIRFFHSQTFELMPDGSLNEIMIPQDASIQGLFKDMWLVTLRSDWKTNKTTFPAGSLVSVTRSHSNGSSNTPTVRALWIPQPRTSLSEVTTTSDAIYLSVSQNVQGKLLRLKWQNEKWATEELNLPAAGSVSLISSDALKPQIFISFESFLQPDSYYEVVDAQSQPQVLKTEREYFKTKDLVAEQREAVSRDGERIPYFIVHRKGMKLDGKNPALLYGYGGFEVSMTPYYLKKPGQAWLERGGVYVLSNIRGGGEFGPAWHQAAKQAHRQKAFDDFYAIAEDLIKSKVTSSRHLGIMGGSNGGLLVGTAMTQRPDLFNAVVCQVPLLDMLRYDKLLAGKFWVEEYGDPSEAAARKVLLSYSPYQNVKAKAQYPEPFLVTSTKDDRVHPGHARKMVAKMMTMGYPVLYYENTQGGHSAAADFKQEAMRSALEYTYLMRKLTDWKAK